MSESTQTAMKDAVRDAINEQIKHELYSAHLYLSMAAFFEVANLPGFSHWMRPAERGRTAARHEVLRLPFGIGAST